MVELIPRQQRKRLFGQWFFLIASVLLCVSVAIVFLVFWYLENNEREILGELDRTLIQDTRPQEQALVAELTSYKEVIDRFALAAAERQDFLPAFRFLEESIIDSVFLTRFQISTEEQHIALSGVADSFLELERQRLLWNAGEQIERVEIINMVLQTEATVQFEAIIVL